MLSPRSVLCPFSPGSSTSAALQQALALAGRVQAPLHITPWPDTSVAREGATGESATEEAVRSAVQSMVVDAPPPPMLHTESWKADSFSVETWLAYTADNDIDLVVLAPPEGHSAGPIMACQALQPMIMRTTAALLTVGMGQQRTSFQRVLTPTDMTPESIATLHHAEAVAAMYDARLDVLHGLAQRKYVALTPTDLLALDDAAMAPRTAKRRLRTWYRRNAHPAYANRLGAQMHVQEGDPTTAILRAVHARKSSLLVMAATQRTPREAGLSPITEKVLRRTTCSVLVTRPHYRNLVAPAVGDSTQSYVPAS